jgi:hypothetical protein
MGRARGTRNFKLTGGLKFGDKHVRFMAFGAGVQFPDIDHLRSQQREVQNKGVKHPLRPRKARLSLNGNIGNKSWELGWWSAFFPSKVPILRARTGY